MAIAGSVVLNACLLFIGAGSMRFDEETANYSVFFGTLPSALAYRNTVLEFCLGLIYAFFMMRLMLGISPDLKIRNAVLGSFAGFGLFAAMMMNFMGGWYRAIEGFLLADAILLGFALFIGAIFAVVVVIGWVARLVVERLPGIKKPFIAVKNYFEAAEFAEEENTNSVDPENVV